MKTLLSFDANGDGSLQKSEVPERMQGLVARADADRNGVLSQAELTKLAESQAASAPPEGGRRPDGPGGMRMDQVMAALDANRDGLISGAEIKVSAAALKALDKNNDGKLTEDEVRPARRGGGEPR